MAFILRSSTLAIKTNSPEIKKYKNLLIKISKHIFKIFITSFLIIYTELVNDTLQHVQSKEDIVANKILSVLLSTPIAIIATILYLIFIILLWITYLIWKNKLKKQNKSDFIDI